jgi:hypothetical protein
VARHFFLFVGSLHSVRCAEGGKVFDEKVRTTSPVIRHTTIITSDINAMHFRISGVTPVSASRSVFSGMIEGERGTDAAPIELTSTIAHTSDAFAATKARCASLSRLGMGTKQAAQMNADNRLPIPHAAVRQFVPTEIRPDISAAMAAC